MGEKLKFTDKLDYDKLGHCIVCGTNLLIPKTIDGVIRNVLHNNFDKVTYTLNDNSTMEVVVCKLCKPNLTEEHSKDIMKKVYKGWVKEIEEHPTHWTPESKKKYLDRYSKISIKKLAKEK